MTTQDREGMIKEFYKAMQKGHSLYTQADMSGEMLLLTFIFDEIRPIILTREQSIRAEYEKHPMLSLDGEMATKIGQLEAKISELEGKKQYKDVNEMVVGLSEKETVLAWIHSKDCKIEELEDKISEARKVLEEYMIGSKNNGNHFDAIDKAIELLK